MSKQEIIIQNDSLFQLLSQLFFRLIYISYLAPAPKQTVLSSSTFVLCYVTHCVYIIGSFFSIFNFKLLNQRTVTFFFLFKTKEHLIYLTVNYFTTLCVWVFCLSVYYLCTMHSVQSARPEEGIGCEPPLWVVGIQCRSSGTAASTPNHWAIPPAPYLPV